VKKKRSFHEFMPEAVWKWKALETKFDHVLNLYDYQEIRLSVLQDHEVLHKGITALMQGREAEQVAARTINLCQPEGELSLLSLRPEGTISVLHHTARQARNGDIFRYYYHGPMFRKDKQGQALEFYQLGVELLGSDSLLSENEIISLGMNLLRELGFREASLKLNSFGCENCRRKFFAQVCQILDQHTADYCPACLKELRANPFAELNCEDERCRQRLPEELSISRHLCQKCRDNFNHIKKVQANLGHPYKVDSHLYKNFAYYNETVFDFVVSDGDKELTVGGGGRYDYLSARITGRQIPAVGFFLDLDEIFRLLDARRLFPPLPKAFTAYICAQSPDMEMMMLQIAQELHADGVKTVLGTEIQSTDAELAKARQHHCDILIVIREDNVREGKLLLHNLARDDSAYIPLNRVTESVRIAQKTTYK